MSEPRPVVPELVARGLGVEVLDYRCRAGAHPPGPEEHNDRHSIVFVRRGVFARTVRGQGGLADAHHVRFFNAGEPYRIEHPVDGGDDCTILALSEPVARDLVARHAPRDADHAGGPFRVGQALSDAGSLRLQYELLGRARRASHLEFEDALVSLLDRACGVIRAGRAAVQEHPRRHRDLAEAARTAVHRDLTRPPSLAQIAASLGCSPFHLSRVFPQVVGMSLRAYVSRLRARAAAEHLARGARDLTRLALEMGYADHSHLTNAFRREWGVPPSVFRAANTP
ncbi:MAG TPA: helix-turn-helix transcriptional regulator [Vicinamibacteria bacterium]|nr:helix-turn-helix transcriptional regulator [Vicinamibacteria bacterium]